MTRWLQCLSLACVLFLTGCNRPAENREAVRGAILQHLQKNAALDLNQLSVDLTDVQFKGSEATAGVSIKPKSAPDQGMSMTYTMHWQNGKWEVKGRGAGHGGAMTGGMPGGGMGDTPPTAPGGTMPPGHPPVNSPPSR